MIAALGVLAARRGDSINPAVWRCVAEPQRWKNASLWVHVAQVVAVRDADFDIITGESDLRIRVEGRSPGGVGSLISFTATFRADGPSLELRRGRVLPPSFRLRWAAELVSIAVVLGILANFARHFLFRPKILQFEKGS